MMIHHVYIITVIKLTVINFTVTHICVKIPIGIIIMIPIGTGLKIKR